MHQLNTFGSIHSTTYYIWDFDSKCCSILLVNFVIVKSMGCRQWSTTSLIGIFVLLLQVLSLQYCIIYSCILISLTHCPSNVISSPLFHKPIKKYTSSILIEILCMPTIISHLHPTSLSKVLAMVTVLSYYVF